MIEAQQLGQPASIDLVTLVALFHGGILSRIAHHDPRDMGLRRIIAPAMRQARQEHARTEKPARVFTEFFYRTRKSWSQSRRVVAKAEQIEGKENPRYVVTSLGKSEWLAQGLSEQLHCARGEMENRIKEQLSLFSDRLSTETMPANQLRLYF